MTRGQGSGTNPPEFSRVVKLESVPLAGFKVDIAAEAAERAAVAARIGVQAVSSLSLKGIVQRAEQAGAFLLTAEVEAEVTQTCVVSLEPLAARLKVRVRRGILESGPGQAGVRQAGAGAKERETVVDPEGEDPPDLSPDGAVDLGEVATEELVLALDPYPRKPGAEWPRHGLEGDGDKEGPFASLRRLKH